MGKRSTAVLLRLAVPVLLWALALQFAPLTPAARQAVQLLPLWALLSFGFYAAGSIGLSILTFPACPEAATELQREIAEARADLTAKGVLKPAAAAAAAKSRAKR